MNKIVKIAIAIAIVVFAAMAVAANKFMGEQQVVVARQSLVAGTTITEDKIQMKSISGSAKLNGVFTSINDVKGKILTKDREENDQISTGIVAEKLVPLEDGDGRIIINVSNEEGQIIHPQSKVVLVTFKTSDESSMSEEFEVLKVFKGTSGVTGTEEFSLLLKGSQKGIQDVGPYVKNGTFKIATVSDSENKK